MLMSNLFTKTLREDPSEAQMRSHKLMLKAGFIRQTSKGIYSWLPLGLKVLKSVENIVRTHMDNSGAQEMLFSALLPATPYKKTGRWDEYGKEMFKLQDRTNSDYLLAPTHEEMFTLIAQEFIKSYKDLPSMVYQIQTKYRDELRPRAGLIRCREFVMKDVYSFDLDPQGLDEAYNVMRNAYIDVFKELGLDFIIVSADSGAMGGSDSEEFLVPTEIGEDTFVEGSTKNGTIKLTANIEALHQLLPDLEISLEEIEQKKVGESITLATPINEIEKLTIKRGIEIGHIFKLGTKYSKAFNFTVANQNGEQQIVWMGSYGIGISRIVAVLAELYSNEKGFFWPKNVAPYKVHIIAKPKDSLCNDYAKKLAKNLNKVMNSSHTVGDNILIDNRDWVSMGVKFADAQMIGCPITVVIGKDFENDFVEIQTKNSTEKVPINELEQRIVGNL